MSAPNPIEELYALLYQYQKKIDKNRIDVIIRLIKYNRKRKAVNVLSVSIK